MDTVIDAKTRREIRLARDAAKREALGQRVKVSEPRVWYPVVKGGLIHDGSQARHGTTTGYGIRCRCDDCRAAMTADARERRELKKGATAKEERDSSTVAPIPPLTAES